MEEQLQIAILNPAGNVTALVLTPVAPARRAALAARLLALPDARIEQAAFLAPPRCGGELRAEMMGGEFCGNALRAVGFYRALCRNETERCCVLTEISGAAQALPVLADPARRAASTVMPLPARVERLGWAWRVAFDGITHYVFDRAAPEDALVRRAVAAAPEAAAVGAVFLDRAACAIRPVVYVRATDSCVAETSCASGSTAAAVVLAEGEADGISEFSIAQPGGTLEVGVRREGGRVTGLSLGGPVELEEVLKLRIEI